MGTKYKVALCEPPVVCYAGPEVLRAVARSQGIARYFTGEPCKYGHIDQRYTSSTMCLRCEKERHATEAYHQWAADYMREKYLPEPERHYPGSKWQRQKAA